jgi:hypothetical protein
MQCLGAPLSPGEVSALCAGKDGGSEVLPGGVIAQPRDVAILLVMTLPSLCYLYFLLSVLVLRIPNGSS